jgi:hypothetical protein
MDFYCYTIAMNSIENRIQDLRYDKKYRKHGSIGKGAINEESW